MRSSGDTALPCYFPGSIVCLEWTRPRSTSVVNKGATLRKTKMTQRFEFDAIRLDRQSSETQYRQLENQIRTAILSGLLNGGSRIPSSRSLSKSLGVSRNSVTAAYEQLISEGYLETQVGSGTCVSTSLPESFEFRQLKPPRRHHRNLKAKLSMQGKQLERYATWLPAMPKIAKPFRPHLPAIDEFPIQVWNQITHEVVRRTASRQLEHCDPQGYAPLRESIAEYMRIARGVHCGADQVIVTSGAQQALALTIQLLLDPHDTVWVEDPGNTPAQQVLELSVASVVPVPLDAEGIDIASMAKNRQRPKLIYVTPSSQWPMGMTMSLQRRMELIAMAQRDDSWILEDDYNGEYRYVGRPQPALCSLDDSGQTIYTGTFSKILFPAIRLGFLIVPPDLAQPFTYAKWLADRFSPPLPQMVLHRFIEDGHFAKHTRRMRSLYRERQRHLHQLVQKYLPDVATVDLPESGMHLIVQGVNAKADAKLIATAKQVGIESHSVAMYANHPKQARGLILGFAAYTQTETTQAIKTWKGAIQGSSR